MGSKFVAVVGLKVTCGECQKQFVPGYKQQIRIFALEPIACPSCCAEQVATEAQCDAIRALGNLISSFRPVLAIMGILGGGFFAMVLYRLSTDDPIPDGVVMLGFVIALGVQLAVGASFRKATEGLSMDLQGVAAMESSGENAPDPEKDPGN